MSEKVTLALVLKEQRLGKPLYEPAPGTQYEVAEGKFVNIYTPTIDRQEEFHAVSQRVGPRLDELQNKSSEDRSFDDMREMLSLGLEIARIIAGPFDGIEVGTMYANMVLRLPLDFQNASRLTGQPMRNSSDLLSGLVQSLSGDTLNGLPSSLKSTETRS